MKQVFDIVSATILVVALSPLLVTLALVIRLDSPGPVFFKAWRVGLHEREFLMYKFRTMVANAATVGPYLTQANDPRVTRVGRILRLMSLDELPQFFNVLLGDMSLVGPRPETPELVQGYNKRQRKVFSVRPGVTGFTQINGRASIPLHRKLDMEVEYIQRQSFFYDLMILLKTPAAVISNRGNLM